MAPPRINNKTEIKYLNSAVFRKLGGKICLPSAFFCWLLIFFYKQLCHELGKIRGLLSMTSLETLKIFFCDGHHYVECALVTVQSLNLSPCRLWSGRQLICWSYKTLSEVPSLLLPWWSGDLGAMASILIFLLACRSSLIWASTCGYWEPRLSVITACENE